MEKSGKHYQQLNAKERATIMLMKREQSGLKKIERFLKRSPSTISNEIARDLGCESGYVASLAGEQARRLRIKPRRPLKLVEGNPLFEVVKEHLQKKWLPEQIAGTLKSMHPDQPL